MDFKVKGKHLEYLFLALFLGLFLWLGASNLFDHKLSHEYPYGYFASDAFLHQTTAQSIKNMDKYVNVIYYKAAGYEDVIAYDPPVSGFMSTLLSYLSGLEVYDTIYLWVFICLLFSVLIIYLLVRELDHHTALLSLPFLLLIFAYTFYSGIIYGQWDFYYATMFMLAALWALNKFEMDKSYLLLGFFGGMAFLSHAVEGIWIAGFVALWMVIKLVSKKFSFSDAKKIAVSGAIGAIVASYFMLIFIKVWLPGRQSKLFKYTTKLYGGYPIASIFDINWILIILLLVGIILFVLAIKDKRNLLPWFGLYILAITYTNYIGFDKALQTRFNLPLYLAVFFGIGIYTLIKLTKARWDSLFSIILAALVCVGFVSFVYHETNSPGIMNPYYWEGLEWIKEKTPEKAPVLYFFHRYLSSRNAFENGERVTNTIDLDDYISAIKKGEFRRHYNKITGRGKLYFKRTAWDWKDRNLLNNSEFEGPTDICNYQYYSFEIYPANDAVMPVVQYNLLLRSKLLEHEQVKEVFNNPAISILKNNNPGAECIF